MITDTLPNGLCPVDASTNYDQSSPTNYASNYNECAAQPGNGPSIEYSSVTENEGSSPPAGSFTLTWNLGTLSTNVNGLDGTITYQAVDRSFYQTYVGSPGSGVFEPAAPTLGGDSFSNSVTVGSNTYATCDDSGTADPECTNPSGTAIYSTGEPGGYEASSTDEAAETNPSEVGQSAPQPSISKLIAAPVSNGGGGITCQQPTTNFTSSTSLTFQQNDIACFLLTVQFPASMYTRDPLVEDYLPPNAVYQTGYGTGSAFQRIPSRFPRMSPTTRLP